MTDPSGERPISDAGCLRCNAPLESLGVHQFRTGGTTGGWKLLFGEWAEVGEDMLPFEVRACRACGNVELRLPSTGR